MYGCFCLVEFARKGVPEIAILGRKLSGVGLLFCGAAKVAASAMIVHGSFSLVNGD